MKNYLIIASMILPIWNWIPSLNQEMTFSVPPKTVNSQMDTEFNEQLLQEWVLMEGQLSEETLVFQKKDKDKHKGRMFQVYRFAKDQSVFHEFYNPEKYMVCGVGMLSIEKGHWSINDQQQLTLSLKGGQLTINEFEYVTLYQIEQLDANELKLRVVKRLKNEVKDFRSF